jgi:broad specificity polyphosphatase/5'/3'-nucleotidase SurE
MNEDFYSGGIDWGAVDIALPDSGRDRRSSEPQQEQVVRQPQDHHHQHRHQHHHHNHNHQQQQQPHQQRQQHQNWQQQQQHQNDSQERQDDEVQIINEPATMTPNEFHLKQQVNECRYFALLCTILLLVYF